MTGSVIAWYRRFDWVNTTFLFTTPILAIIFGYWFFTSHTLTWGWGVFAFLCFVLPSMGITAGYHRHFAHRSFDVKLPVKIFYLMCGAASFQGSALKWCADHRRHHRFVDTEKDPYSIKKGFWHAHMGWVLLREDPQYAGIFPPDLKADKWVALQHKFYGPLAILVGFGFPAIGGYFLGSAWGGLVLGGLIRVVFTQHCTFFINSLCHYIGNQPYNLNNTARDSAIMAFLAYGEGYHNFHHQFMNDYRNGIRWYHWDPTKWSIQLFAFTGLASRLKRVSNYEILRARMVADHERLVECGVPPERLQALKLKVEEASQKWKQIKEDYQVLKKNMCDNSRQRFFHLKAELKVARLEFKMAWAQWSAYRRTFRAMPAGLRG